MLGIIDILRRKRLKKDMRHDERKIYPVYKNLRSIIFFYYLETPEDIGILDRCCEIFKNHRLNYTGFAYAKKKKIMMSARQSIKYDITIFGNRTVTLLGIPKQWFTAQFADKKYDLLINFNDKPDFTAKYLAATIDTSFTVAMREERDIRYDMIISGPEGAMLGKGEFADQVCHYLKSISSAPYSPLHETKREKGGEDEG